MTSNFAFEADAVKRRTVSCRVRAPARLNAALAFQNIKPKGGTMSVEDIEFEWDEDKNTANIFKHGIDFWDAIYIWNDRLRQERYDLEHSTANEDRWQTIGMSRFGVLMVVYTDKVHFEESNVRIISARKAEPHEIKKYQSMTYSTGTLS